MQLSKRSIELTVNFSHDAKAPNSQRAAAARLRPQRPEEAQSAISTAWLRPSFQIQDGRSGDRRTHPEATQACEKEPKLTC